MALGRPPLWLIKLLENVADISRQGNLLTQILRIQQTYLVTGTGEGPGAEENACSLGTAGFQKEGREGAELIYRFSFWTHHSDEILCLLWDRVCGGGEDQEWSSGGERSSPPFQHIQVEMAQKYWVCLPGSARPIIHHLWHTTSISVKWNKNLKIEDICEAVWIWNLPKYVTEFFQCYQCNFQERIPLLYKYHKQVRGKTS